ncbi:MAG: PDZ domain-containing protein [Phycisphaerales bacterium]|nr:PDZ domain-containing protein [Phycisphaerales bacterium]
MNKQRLMVATMVIAAGTLATWSAVATSCPDGCGSEEAEAFEIRSVQNDSAAPHVLPARFGDSHENVVLVEAGDQGTRTIKIVQNNGEYVVYVNGEKVASGSNDGSVDRLLNRWTGDQMVRFRNGDGDIAFTADATLQWVGDEEMQKEHEHALHLLKMGENEPFGVAVAAPAPDHPPVMVGVMMEDVDENLASYLGIDPGHATRITRVIEGLPAAKGGLRTQDIIVRIDGREAAAPDDIRAVLRKKNPGDVLAIKVLRAGQPQELKIRLEAFQPTALGLEPGAAPKSGDLGFFAPGDLAISPDDNDFHEYDVVIDDLMKTLREHLGNNQEAMQELESQLKGLRIELKDQFGNPIKGLKGWSTEAAPSWRVPTIPDEALKGGMYRFYIGDDEDGAVIVPRTPSAPGLNIRGRTMGADTADELEQRMDRLDERLDRLEQLLERLVERTERGERGLSR